MFLTENPWLGQSPSAPPKNVHKKTTKLVDQRGSSAKPKRDAERFASAERRSNNHCRPSRRQQRKTYKTYRRCALCSRVACRNGVATLCTLAAGDTLGKSNRHNIVSCVGSAPVPRRWIGTIDSEQTRSWS